MLNNWLPWALLSACFAALTAVFAKLGVQKINPNHATFIRTLVIAISIAMLLLVMGGFHSPATLPRRAWLFLILSGLATGASWLCYFRAMSLGQAAEVAPVEKNQYCACRAVRGRPDHRGRRAHRVPAGLSVAAPERRLNFSFCGADSVR